MWSATRPGPSSVARMRRPTSSERRAARRSRLALGVLEDRSLPSFIGPVDYALGAGPTATATGLFNNDTIPDLVVANYSDGTVSVLLGNGDGTFQPAVSSPTGGNPSSVAVGDFNGDGKMDVATANGADVSVLIGNGDGTFQAPTSITVGDSPKSAAVGDFNADGKLDLGVVSNTYYPGYWGYWGWYPGYYVGRASVLIGTGTGSFGAPVTTWLGGGYHTGGASADFNGDGRSDLAVANADNGTVGVALADLSGALQGPTYYSAGATPGSIIAADVSGDGKADVVTANWYSNTVSVLLGNGLGGFGTAATYATGEPAVAVATGDFNGPGGDGKTDLAVATGYGGVSVLLGQGSGAFTLPVPVTNGSYLGSISASDFNGDGWLDAAAANASTNSASVFVNDHVWPAADAPSLSVGDVTVTEGNSGTVAANFQVSLSAPSSQSVSIQYTTVDGSATAASGDYQAKTGTLTFAPGQTTQTIPVLVNGDRVGEWDENFSVRLSNPTNAFVSDPTGWGTIHDDEPTIDVTSFATGPEGNSGTSLLAVTVNLSAPYDAPVSVDFATADLTPDEEYWYGPAATAGDDYQSAAGTLTIPAGATSGTIYVTVNGDRVSEPDELFWVNLSNPSGGRLGNSQSIVTILNDEPVVSVNSPGTVTEGNSGTTAVTFTVTLSNQTDVPVTATYETADGSATAPGDYQAKTGTVTFNAGETSKTVTVLVNGDRVGEGDEWFSLNLTGADGAGIASATGWANIRDDEPQFNISSPSAIREGNSGTKLLTFTVTLSAAYDQPVTVRYATQDGSARAGEDFVATSGTLTFSAGQTTKTFTVAIKGDKKKESDEYFNVVLSSPSSNAWIGTNTAWGTILNDDGPKGHH